MLTRPSFPLLSKVVSGTEVEMVSETGDKFLERPRKLFYVCRVCIQDLSFGNAENDTMKLSLNEAKLTGLWARNCAAIGFWFWSLTSGPKSFRRCCSDMGNPMPKSLVIWASSSRITLGIWVRVRVTGDAISLGFWEWGCPKRGNAHITVTPGLWRNGPLVISRGRTVFHFS